MKLNLSIQQSTANHNKSTNLNEINQNQIKSINKYIKEINQFINKTINQFINKQIILIQ